VVGIPERKDRGLQLRKLRLGVNVWIRHGASVYWDRPTRIG
jgi:hypothetical protein